MIFGVPCGTTSFQKNMGNCACFKFQPQPCVQRPDFDLEDPEVRFEASKRLSESLKIH